MGSLMGSGGVIVYIAPSLGMVTANLMFLAPYQAIAEARKERTLGDIGPLPFPLIISNCIGWLVFSFLAKDYFIFFSNAPGLILGTNYFLTVYGLADWGVRWKMQLILSILLGLLALTGLIAAVTLTSHSDTILFVGFITNFLLILYYSAPVATFYAIVKSGDASSLSWPTAIMNCVNGTLWVLYGAALQDPFIYVSNGVGALLGLIQIFFVFWFASSTKDAARHKLAVSNGNGATGTSSMHAYEIHVDDAAPEPIQAPNGNFTGRASGRHDEIQLASMGQSSGTFASTVVPTNGGQAVGVISRRGH